MNKIEIQSTLTCVKLLGTPKVFSSYGLPKFDKIQGRNFGKKKTFNSITKYDIKLGICDFLILGRNMFMRQNITVQVICLYQIYIWFDFFIFLCCFASSILVDANIEIILSSISV